MINELLFIFFFAKGTNVDIWICAFTALSLLTKALHISHVNFFPPKYAFTFLPYFFRGKMQTRVYRKAQAPLFSFCLSVLLLLSVFTSAQLISHS